MRLGLVALILWLAGCGVTPPGAAPPPPPPDPMEQAFAARKDAVVADGLRLNPLTGQREFSGQTELVILSDFQFSPATLHFKSGTLVRVRLSNTALVTHYFGGKEFFRRGAETVNLLGSYVPPGQHHIPVAPLSDRDIYLYIKHPGDYLLDCFVPNHRVAGMVGRLVVEP